MRQLQSAPIEIDIWSDVVCPFCYIGKRHLEQALEQSGLRDGVNIVWHSFELAPDAITRPEGSIYEELGKRKGWSVEQSQQIHHQMEERAREAGLEFDFSKTVPANSRQAHRLLHLAKKQGVQNEVKELLLKGYFTDGANIDRTDYLVDVAAQAGLDKAVIREALGDVALEKEIDADIMTAQQLGIQGVPFFVVNQKYAVSGAQPISVFVQALEKIREEMKPVNVAGTDGDVCGPDGVC